MNHLESITLQKQELYSSFHGRQLLIANQRKDSRSACAYFTFPRPK